MTGIDDIFNVRRQTLFADAALQIGLFESRPKSDICGDVERQSLNAVVLPLSGVFAKHDAPGRNIVATPSHAAFIAADVPYRISYPGSIGDKALTLRFDHTLAPERLDPASGRKAFAPHGLLGADAMMLRNLLWTRLRRHDADVLEIESIGLELLGMSLQSMRAEAKPVRSSALIRRTRALARVTEAVALAPAGKWTVSKLAGIANLSPFHLCHVFRQMVGVPIYDYVIRERLAHSLDAVLACDNDLTSIALDAGFASHSHFTARFRTFFGCTPAALRRMATARDIADLRKIVTAQRSALA